MRPDLRESAKTHRYFWTTSLSSALIASLLGAAVLLGWYTRNEALIQINPAFVPMQYNTALGFLLSGLGLAALAFSLQKSSTGAGILVALIGGITLVEYLFGVDLLLDQLFMEHYIDVETSSPGRKSKNRVCPNTHFRSSLAGWISTKRPSTSISRRYVFR